jgi:hypothetical protein
VDNNYHDRSNHYGGQRDNRNRNNGNGNRDRNKNKNNEKNRLKEKELGLKTAKVAAFQKVFEEQVKSMEKHELILKQIVPPGFVEKVVRGRTTTLPNAEQMINSLNDYFSKEKLSVVGTDYRAIVTFLGVYQAWRDEKMKGYKDNLEYCIIEYAGVTESETATAKDSDQTAGDTK